MGVLFLLLILAIGILFYLLNRPSFQNYLAQHAVKFLSEKLHTPVTLEKVEIDFFNTLDLQGLYIEDLQKDTLLYAGHLKANVSLFSLLDEQLLIQDIALENTTFHLKQSKDDVLNLQFIIDALSSKDTTNEKKPFAWKIDLEEIALEKIKFIYSDEKAPYDLTISTSKGKIVLDSINFAKTYFGLEKLEMDGFQLIYNSLPRTHAQQPATDEVTSADSSLAISKRKIPLDFWVKNFILKDSEVDILNTTQTPANHPYFDPNYIYVQNLQMEAQDVHNINDSIFAKIEKGAFVESDRFHVQEFTSDFKFAFDELRFNDLKIKTEKSLLQHQFSMHYKSFAEFSHFVENVYMQGTLTDSKIAWEDIAYFGPTIYSTPYIKDLIGTQTSVRGEFTGPVARLKVKNAHIAITPDTKIEGDISFNGLPDINTTFLQVDAKELTTNPQDLHKILPSVKLPIVMNELGKTSFKGHFTGFIRDFVADGVLQSEAGTLTTDVNMKFNQNYTHATYKGKIKTENLELGKLTQKPELLGKATIEAEVDGSGLTFEDLATRIKGSVKNIEFKKHNYQNIQLEGNIKDKIFEGSLESLDPTLAVNFMGKVDFNTTNPVYDFNANIIRADLQQLDITKKPCMITSQVQLDIVGKHIDSIIGNAVFKDIDFMYDNKNYKLDVLKVFSTKRNKNREISLKSNLFDAYFTGDFLPSDLPAEINEVVTKYFPSQSFTDKKSIYNNQIDYNLKIYDSDKLTELFIPDLKGVKNAMIDGSMNGYDHTFTVKGTLPSFYYKNYYIDSLSIGSRGDVDNIIFSSYINNIKVNENLKIPNVVLTSNIYTDSTRFNLIAGLDQDSTRFNIKGIAIASQENIKINILPSEIYINHVPWKTNLDNQIIVQGKNINIVQLDMYSDQQSVSIHSTGNDFENLHAEIQKLKIQDLMSLTGKNKYDLKGEIEGNVDLTNIYKNFSFETRSTIPKLIIGNDTIGRIVANVTQVEKGLFKINAELKDENLAIVRGEYNMNDKKSPIDLIAEVEKFELKDLSKFVVGIFSDMKGIIFSDKVSIQGAPDDININGQASAFGEFTVDYLQAHYRFNKLNVAITKNAFTLPNSTLYDADNNEAIVNASITHRNFNDITFDINADTKNFIFLNTTKKDNELFYGKAYCEGHMNISGPIEALEFNIRAKSNENTVINLPIGNETEIKKEEFIVFLNPHKDTNQVIYKKSLNGIKLFFALEATPDAKMRIILDEDAGDIIEARGTGNIDLNINTLGDFFINGEYVIDNGDYLFTFRNIINKKFEIDQGSTIRWDGDPYQAVIDIRAIYKTKAFIGELVKETSSSSSESATKRADVNLILSLTGSLLKPNVDFDYNFPKAIGSGVDDLSFQAVNDAIKRDKNELNKQVMGLLAANTFLPLDASSSGNTAGNISATGITTITEFLSTQLSKYLNDFLSEYITGFDINLAYRNYTDNNTDRGNQLLLSMRKKFFDERVEIVVGGNYDMNNSADSVKNNFAGDFELIYNFKSNPLKLKAFRKTDTDIFNDRNITKNGIGIFYKVEFNSFKELFASTEKKKKMLRKRNTSRNSSKKTLPTSVYNNPPAPQAISQGFTQKIFNFQPPTLVLSTTQKIHEQN